LSFATHKDYKKYGVTISNFTLSTGWHTIVGTWSNMEEKIRLFFDGTKLGEATVLNTNFPSSWYLPLVIVGDDGQVELGYS